MVGSSTGGLKGKVGIVIGGSGDFGAPIAEQVTQGGATTVITYLRDRTAADEVVSRLADQPGPAEAAQLDATDATQVNALFDEVIGRHGHVDIVVHLPGMVIKKSLAELSDADFTQGVESNLRTAFNVLRAGGRHPAHGGGGARGSAPPTRA